MTVRVGKYGGGNKFWYFKVSGEPEGEVIPRVHLRGPGLQDTKTVKAGLVRSKAGGGS